MWHNIYVQHLSFKVYADHQDIHSFPTRRSSDLARQRALDNFKGGRLRVLVATDIAARGIDVDGITHVVNYEDRKSTRLNSSHVSISYAVFCLKKKNFELLLIDKSCTVLALSVPF